MQNYFAKNIVVLFLFCCLSAGRAGVLAGEADRFADVQAWPRFTDDGEKAALGRAIFRSIGALQGLAPGRQYDLCGKTYAAEDLVDSLQRFLQLLEKTGEPSLDFEEALRREFDLCQATGSLSEERVLVTGYYEPVFPASIEKRAPYNYPLYRRPADLEVAPPRDENAGREIVRRLGGKLVPYWSRREIETSQVLAGQELIYLADPLAVFVLHIQGSGQVVLPDGTRRRVQFAAKNGREYRSIGRLLVERGKMRLEGVDLPKILEYLRSHPDEVTEILHYNESYVFFRWGDDGAEGPLGSLGVPLIAGRSVALDQKFFPPGILCYLETRKPRVTAAGVINGWTPMRRFVLNQDSGSAITGPGRLDFFWGSGTYAEAAAGAMKQSGKLYVLIRKK